MVSDDTDCAVLVDKYFTALFVLFLCIFLGLLSVCRVLHRIV